MIIDRSGYSIRPERGKAGSEETVHNTTKGHVYNLQDHAQVFLDCIRSRCKPPADVEVGHFASNPGHLMNISWRVGRRIAWDAEREQVLNDPEANALVTKHYRTPWKLEV